MAGYNEIRRVLGDTVKAAVGELNVYNYLPSNIAAPAAVIRTQTPTADYMTTWSCGYAEWLFEILLIIGKVSDESAQTMIGDLITPDSALIQALNDVEFSGGPGHGHAHVRKATVSDIKVGSDKYACGRMTVLVRA